MTGFLTPFLIFCGLLLVPCVIAASGLRLDLRITLGDMPAPPRTLWPEEPIPVPTGGVGAVRQTLPSAYANHSIRIERVLASHLHALQTIAGGREPASALIARKAGARVHQGGAPTTTLAGFARQRLELIALGNDREAAATARRALER